jgi:hypothetical protein
MRAAALALCLAACGGSSSALDASTLPGDDAGPTPDAATPGEVWHPATGTSWAWQLSGRLDSSIDVAMYDVDLFVTTAQEIQALHDAGRVVICYFSAGTFENGRPDADSFAEADIGKVLPDWPDERWLDTRATGVRAIMKTRLELAVAKKCDGVEPDNVDAYANDSGFTLSKQDQLDYNTFLATEAHARRLSVGLKNALGIVAELQPAFDWALNEECLSFEECSELKPFVDAGKAVFHVEYVDKQADGPARRDAVCGDSTITGFSTLIKTWDLDAWYLTCG